MFYFTPKQVVMMNGLANEFEMIIGAGAGRIQLSEPPYQKSKLEVKQHA